MGFEIHVYLISAGPTQLPVFNCTLRILLRVPRVNSQFHSAQLPVTPQASPCLSILAYRASLASPFGRGGRAQRGRRGQAKKSNSEHPHPAFFMNIFPALGKTVSYKALPHRAAFAPTVFTGEYHGQYEPRTLYR